MFIKDWKKDYGNPEAEAENRKFRQENIKLKERILELEYEYESALQEICNTLGWQGWSIHQVVIEIKRLREKDV